MLFRSLFLFLLLYELAERKELVALIDGDEIRDLRTLPWANPCLSDHEIASRFDEFLSREGIGWVR